VALTYASSIVWNADIADEALWTKLHRHFSNPELVELGFFIALTLGAAAVDQDARDRPPRGTGRHERRARAA